MVRKFIVSLGIAALTAVGWGLPAEAAMIEYTAGHADIGVAIEDGELNLHYHFGGDAVLDNVLLGSGLDEEAYEYDPSEVYVRVPDSQMFNVDGTIHSGVGLGPGAGDVWVLSQNNLAGLPFLGFGTEDLPQGSGNTVFSLLGVSGPGNFSLWTAGFGFSVKWDSVDGFGADDAFSLPAGSHSHYNWGFTAPGVYYVDVLATNGSLSDSGRFTFLVGDQTTLPEVVSPVPEPASLALAGMGGLALCGGALRRRRAARSN